VRLARVGVAVLVVGLEAGVALHAWGATDRPVRPAPAASQQPTLGQLSPDCGAELLKGIVAAR
jgi:hypothetical protein